jgi:P27 family predicted phage terminase small subunit
MAKRGPKPTPTPTLKLRGGFRNDRHGSRPGGDTFDHKMPRCPQRFIRRQENPEAETVRKVAKQTWDRLCPTLFQSGLLVDAFKECFILLCDSYARYVLCCQMLDQDGHTSESSKGSLTKSPWARLRSEFHDQVCKGAAAFGLSPADVAGVRAVEKPTVEDSKKRFFGGPRNGA